MVALNAAGREHIYREKASGGRWERLSRPLREEAGAGFRSLTHAIDKPKIGSFQRANRARHAKLCSRESGQFYFTSTIGAREKANFCPISSTRLTWQVYLPGFKLASAISNSTGTACCLEVETFLT